MTTNAITATVPMKIQKSFPVMTVETIHAHTVAGAMICVRPTKLDMRTNMPKTTYLIELCVDEEWFHAISELTAEVHEGEICEWVRVQAETETSEDDCENCESNPKEHPEGKWCTSCKDEFKESEEDDE
jgi:hypothetical protein